jgi:Uma2 family endonuclease
MKKPTTEDLLRIIEANKERLPEPRQHVNDVHKFIEAMDLKQGKHETINTMVYKAYRHWGGKRTKAGFMRLFSMYFLLHRSGSGRRFYNLNVRAVELLNKVDNGLIKI